MTPLEELKLMDKNIENTKSFVNKYLPKVAFDMSSRQGFPFEMFQEEMKLRNYSLLDQLALIINHYKK